MLLIKDDNCPTGVDGSIEDDCTYLGDGLFLPCFSHNGHIIGYIIDSLLMTSTYVEEKTTSQRDRRHG